MELFKSFPIYIFMLIGLLCTYTNVANFEIQNKCPFTIWAASVPVGGGKQLDSGQTWKIDVPAGKKQGRIWARTGCTFDGTGRGRCETGDCNGLLECNAFGLPRYTLAEYGLNQFNGDNFCISLLQGFNVHMEFSPTSNGCTRGTRCAAVINGQCPNQLKVCGGCNNSCTVFKTDKYCCNSGKCRPTDFSKFFKERCPDAYTYPKDDPTTTFTCPRGTNYKVVFCP